MADSKQIKARQIEELPQSQITGLVTALAAVPSNLAYTKGTALSGTGTQAFDLANGWLVDSTISGAQEINFSNGILGANGVIKLINTNGNLLDLSGAGLTFKRSVSGVLEANAQITLEAGATTEQLVTFHFHSATEVIFTVK